MKKLVLTIGCTVAVAGAALAQGTVNWSSVGGFFVAQTNGTAYSSFEASQGTPTGTQGATFGGTAANSTALGYSGYYYELLVSSSAVAAPTTVAGLAAWSDTGLSATNGAASNGRIIQTASGGVAGNTQAVANNWPSGTTESAILVGWSANLGTSWSTVLTELQNWTADYIPGAYFGVSSLGSLASQTGNPGVVVFGTSAGQINNGASAPEQLDLLGTVPEPGTLALAAIGGASLLMFRRKK